MNSVKPWYLSKTIWAALVSIAATFGSALGMPVDQAASEGLVEAILQLVSAGAGAVAILGRMTARSRIG